MRILTFSKLLAVGGVAAWAAQRFLRSRPDAADYVPPASVVEPDLAPDPNDPVQGIDEAGGMQVHELDVDAFDAADLEAAQDLAVLDTSDVEEGSSVELDMPSETTIEATDVAVEDTGELYGVHTPVAVDHEIPDGDQSFAEGENWLEALEASATEYGPEPEEDIDVVDDMDVPPHPSDTHDTPVADRGSGGPSGV